jgi:DNA helicase-2/ATP-dependent DNA helicase PcrA
VTDLLADLNPAQRDAVSAPDGPVLVVAGAGSGKTRVLTTRVAWLLQHGVRPSEILAFTLTNKAAGEMKERVAEAVGPDRAPFWIGTFHATGARILRTHGDRLGLPKDFAIYDSDDQKRLLKNVLAGLKIDPKQFGIPGCRQAISAWKNEDDSPEAAAQKASTYVEEIYAKIYAGYQDGLRQCKAVDFDDLILETVHLLEQCDDVREEYAGRFRHVLVDEFQDTNALQLVLIKALSSRHGNLFAVGDDDQSIYGWRGARVENMLDFEELFRGTHLFRLEQNYRSMGNILDAANAVIAHNTRRKGKNLWTDAGKGDLLTVEQHLDAEDEAARVVEIVQAEQARGKSRGDITVLYRTNAQSRLLEDALRRARVPHQVVGSVQFYERREIRDLLAYLKLTANPADEVSLQRAINQPKRKIGDTTVARLLGCAHDHQMPVGDLVDRMDLLQDTLGPAAAGRVHKFLLQLAGWRRASLEGVPVPEVLQRIIADIDYEDFLHRDEPDTAAGRMENVAELVNGAFAFHEASDGGTLMQYLEQTALVADQDTIEDGEGAVRLMTIHTAKGLEFPVVVLTGCEDELLPHITSSDTLVGVEEERRLFYVAVTRAMTRLYLLNAGRRRRFGAYEDTLPSRFLAEIPDELCERREIDHGWQQPVARTLFGDAPASRRPVHGGGRAASSRGSRSTPARSTPARGGGGGGGGPAGHRPMPTRRDPFARPPQAAKPAGWDADVTQAAPFYPGQTVAHSSFGAGTVVRVEGQGADVEVTVDFPDHGRKHILPRFAPLMPLD